MDALARRLAVARGDEPADLVVRGGRVLAVFTKEWLDADVAIVDGVFAGLGEYEGRETLDADGRYVIPGFVDAHMHLESVKLLVDEFDPPRPAFRHDSRRGRPARDRQRARHRRRALAARRLRRPSLDVYFTASSCVPASRFESPRRPLVPGDLEGLLRRRRMVGLAEMMNYPA